MLRYFAFASAIVFTAILALLALPRPGARPVTGPQYHGGGATPGSGGNDRDVRGPDVVGGVAPWALSAVPECFRQVASFAGSAAFARGHLPPGARAVGADSRLRVADCVLDVRDGSAELRRGESRFIVPRRASFSVAGSTLVLDQSDGAREEVRLYHLAGGARPRFSPAGH